jgi:hypothetical protein
MEIQIKGGLRTRTQFGLVKTIGNLLRAVAPFRFGPTEVCISSGMFVSGFLPYEASETYRRIKVKLDRDKAKAMVEAHVQFFGAF